MSSRAELKNRVIFTTLVLLAYRFGTFIPIPGVNADALKLLLDDSGGFGMFGMINLFSGGAFERMSIFALNIMPYITSSIIMQLMTSMYKGLEVLKKDGEYGRAKVNQYTRYLTIVLALFQSLGVYYALSSPEHSVFGSDSKVFLWTTSISLVGGTVMLMWFGEKITSSGIGNGISLIIFVGIVSSLPSTVVQVFDLTRSGVYSGFVVILFLTVFAALLLLVCFTERAYRRIKIQYPNLAAMRNANSGDHSFLPIKVNISGVIPPIFASSILMFPIALLQFFNVENDILISAVRKGGPIYFLLFAGLILFFSYFYSSIIFNTEEISNNLRKSNCFVLGVRPGISTATYLDKIVANLALFGAIYLIFVCITPELLVSNYSIPLYIGGTGILIMVSVVLDFINQVQSYILVPKSGRSRRRKIRV